MILRVVKQLRSGVYKNTIIVSETTSAETELFNDYGNQELEAGGAFLASQTSYANITEPMTLTGKTLILTTSSTASPVTITFGAETTVAGIVTKINTDTATTIASAVSGPKLRLQNVDSFTISALSTALTDFKLYAGTWTQFTLDSNIIGFTGDFPLHQDIEITDTVTEAVAEAQALAWITQMQLLMTASLTALRARTDDFSGEAFVTI